MKSNSGFTLVEMLVVITIIGILIVALIPLVKGAQVRAKESAITSQCTSIEAGLATYAMNHNGNYPGVAIDVMAPFADHALGDPAIYDGSASLAPASGTVVNGVMGGYGHYNNSTANVFEQLKNAKDTPLGGAPNATPRYFDVLMAADAIQEYPPNPFLTTTTGERSRMRNIFVFTFDIGGGFDSINNFSPNESNPSNADYDCSLYVPRGGASGIATPDTFDTMRVLLNHQPLNVPLGAWTAPSFSTACEYGTDDDDYFAPGDFAYVPIMSASAYGFGDSGATLENEYYKWGTNVTGYLMFAYGSKTHKNNEFEDEQREFVSTGLPGFGDSGVDTIYENTVLQLFEGAIYFSKQY